MKVNKTNKTIAVMKNNRSFLIGKLRFILRQNLCIMLFCVRFYTINVISKRLPFPLNHIFAIKHHNMVLIVIYR